ncbi:MAG: response regulator [Clostridiaceae bacterium]|nr:response regulator [Clostridiaceae bacterium]
MHDAVHNAMVANGINREVNAKRLIIKTMLIGDEQVALEQLKCIVEQYEELEVLKAFADSEKVLQKISKIKPDLVFLDISIPGSNGFMTAEKIKNIAPSTEIVFVTAYDDYAIRAFEINAMDYILKPVTKSRIDKTIKRAINFFPPAGNGKKKKISQEKNPV